MSERASARHRADLPPSTPLTGIATSISAVVVDHAATIGRGGVVVAVSSGLVTGMGLPAAAAATVSDTPQTASVPLLAGPAEVGVAATADVLASAPVSAPTKATISFEHSAFTAVAKGSVSAATPMSATRDVATISRSLARAAFRAAKPANPAVKDAVRSATSARRSSAGAGGATEGGTGHGTGNGTRRGSGDGGGVGSGGTTKPVPPVTPPVDDQSGVVAIALRYLGIAYRYGGTTPRGFDCSGFTQYVFGQAGVSLPRTADQQLRAASRISRSEARAGDLVFFLSGGYAYHVGIYLGNGKMVDSPRRGSVVTVRSVYSSNVAFARA